jgi:hypothetical protein
MQRISMVLAAATAALAPAVAEAKLACYPLDKIEQALGTEFGEKQRFAGRESEGVEYRLYVNAETGSWSWVGVPAGTKIGCLIFAGKSHADMPSAPPAAQPAPPSLF